MVENSELFPHNKSYFIQIEGATLSEKSNYFKCLGNAVGVDRILATIQKTLLQS